MSNNVYIGSRYLPLFAGAWSPIKSYEALIIVEYGNNSYTSKRPVPVNTPPTTGDENDPYWGLSANYNGQISNLQQQINTNTSNITALSKSIDPINFDIIVASDGSSDYTSLSAAVAAANNGDRIFVKNGIYSNEAVEAQTKTLTIIGEESGKVVIINNYGEYSRAPIEIGSGYVKNISFVSSATSGGAYGAHIDWPIETNNRLVFEDCAFSSNNTYAVGIGTRNGFWCTFIRCEFTSTGSFGALFVHPSTDSANYGSNQHVTLIDCLLVSGSATRVIVGEKVGDSTNILYVRCVGCTLRSDSGNKVGLVGIAGTADGRVIFEPGGGNNYAYLNDQYYADGTRIVDRWGDKAVKRFIADGSITAGTQKVIALPNDLETLISVNGYITATSTGITYPFGCHVGGSSDEYQAYLTLPGTAYVFSSTYDGTYFIEVTYVSSETTVF